MEARTGALPLRALARFRKFNDMKRKIEIGGRMVAGARGLLFKVTAAGILGATQAAFAEEGTSYFCEFDNRSRFEGVLPEAVGFVVGDEGGGTLVFDPIINSYYNEPIEAELLVDNEARVSIRWIVKAIFSDTGKSRKFQFDLTLLKGPMTARIAVKLAAGETLEPSAPGSCVIQKW